MLRAISYILATAVFTTPWFIGGNWPFTRFVLLGLGAAGLFVTFATLLASKSSKLGGKDSKIGLPLIWLVLTVGCLFTAFQASSASSWLQQQFGAANPAISLHQTINETADSESPSSTPTTLTVEKSTKRPVSVYPAATREKLVDLILSLIHI